jgi:hypothetical protein
MHRAPGTRERFSLGEMTSDDMHHDLKPCSEAYRGSAAPRLGNSTQSIGTAVARRSHRGSRMGTHMQHTGRDV